MLSVEDIRNAQFTKNLGGYKTNEVDDFLDQCEETVGTLLAEKADLTNKMNILADKVMEYRKDEDSLRTALLDAHKMAEQIEKGAREMADKILADAKAIADQLTAEAQTANQRAKAEAVAGIEAEKAELQRVKDEVATFKAHVLRMYREQVELIETLPGDAPVVASPAPASAQVPVTPVAPVTPVVPVTPVAPVAPVTPVAPPAPVTPAAPVANKTLDQVVMPPVKNAAAPAHRTEGEGRFADLKFGESYDIADDDDDDGKRRGFFKRKK